MYVISSDNAFQIMKLMKAC